MKILVAHAGYGCDTGCCGHVIKVDDLAPGQREPVGVGSRNEAALIAAQMASCHGMCTGVYDRI